MSNNHMPEQVQKQAEDAADKQKQLAAGADGDATEPVAPEPPESPEPASGPQGDAGNTTTEDALLHKYKTLQGMYNAEVPRLHHENRELAQRLQSMEQLIATMSYQPQQQQQQPAAAYVTEADVEEYGDSIEVMRRAARDEMRSLNQRLADMETTVQRINSSVVPQVQQVARQQHANAEQGFWAELSSAVPNFRDINADPNFLAWLGEADPMTGITRQTYLDDAQRRFDARRVASIFHSWSAKTGGGNQSIAPSQLEQQIAPGRSRGSGVPAATGSGTTYSPEDIRRFFDDVRTGKYKGREQERSRIERDIFAAQREGRIRMT